MANVNKVYMATTLPGSCNRDSNYKRQYYQYIANELSIDREKGFCKYSFNFWPKTSSIYKKRLSSQAAYMIINHPLSRDDAAWGIWRKQVCFFPQAGKDKKNQPDLILCMWIC